ncbi:DNA helicase-2/ATP-dependent DNA helicase PcrA [Rhizomicrobium palustre]|uniref:DNA 3'-5' helicase n=1 Tax=Rhizomicrobium palustre TaxID=189966 RepID=A0A846MVB7_9PROT|nr:UvrD-helicase domain-containing protein [Rhizomicrobium palustre]NIK87478.1 DNA helicase-2/ATP-dependent DNA helicase PcrA [Rhizomicrobium palustre]
MTGHYEDPLDSAFGEDHEPAPVVQRDPPYLQGLNKEQREAVEATDGPVLVLAGAGTGKTRVLTTRLAHILSSRKAWPSQLLCVTFTNKAAREMKERIGALIGGVVEGMQWLGTFHSIGARMLRHHAELVGRKSNFTIIDTDDQLRLMKQLLEAENIDEKRWPARTLASMIDGWKNRGLKPADVPDGEAHGFANGKGKKLYHLYQERLKALNACDFGDLLLDVLSILREHPDVLADYRERFRYILVDEYQDTNTVQYLWLKLLAGGGTGARGNVCVVGDDDQSIYGWRGAEVENILRFERDFPGAKVIRLERNYRSTPAILAAASGLIAANKGRLGKTLWTEGDTGEKLQVKGVWDAEEEARNVASEIENLRRKGHPYSQMAILVRASFQMREFEDRFVSLGLPYKVIGGPRFYERAEIRDAMAYLRLVAQGDDDLAFERIVNKPKRGIGDASVQVLHQFARMRQMPLLAAAREIVETDELPPKAKKALTELTQSFYRWTEVSRQIPHTELAEMILDESGYTDMLKADKSAEAPGRLDNLKELVRSMDGFESLAAFLEHIALVMDVEQNDSEDRINLMTLHAAKGLEFDTVFLPGWEEGLFPSQRTMDENGLAGLEEERRLAYVGITRAKKRAFLSFAANRRVHGSWQSALPSRFISELPEEHVETAVDEGFYGGNAGFRDNLSGFASTYDSPGWKRAQANKAQGYTRAKPPLIEAQAWSVSTSDPTASLYQRGDRVFHQKFGYGRVKAVEGNKLTVDFDKAGEKKVIDQFVSRG